ncbi:MAG: hypothetical protein AB7I33_16535 [Gemmatimonadales bacterium]
MTSATRHQSNDTLPPALALAFAPLHKRAFGMAVGLALGLTLMLATVVVLIRRPPEGVGLALLSQYFKGYSVSWPGAFIGLGWGFLVGFVGGWFVAFCRNLVIAASVFWIRARSELAQTRDFLDHI